jgi:hypothetical protein
MDPNEQTEATVDVAAEQTLSPSETNGASSSEAAVEAPETSEEAIRREFLEKYGSDDGEETPDAEDVAAAADDTDTPEAAQKPETDIQSDDDEDDAFRIPDEDFKGLPQGVKQRIGHLNAKAKKAEREKSELEAQITPLRDAHERFSTLQNYVKEHDIQPQNVTLAFDAMAKMSRGDFQGFIDAIKPFYDHALQAAGAAIAPDLQQQVDDGYLTEDHAKELTKARVQTQTFKGQAEQFRQRDSQRQEQERQGQQTNDMLAAINNREAQLKASDPDYALKSQAMRSAIQFALENGAVPKTKDDAIRMVNKAYENASASFVKPTPPKATPPRPSASTPSRGRPEPASTRDAITQALRDVSA